MSLLQRSRGFSSYFQSSSRLRSETGVPCTEGSARFAASDEGSGVYRPPELMATKGVPACCIAPAKNPRRYSFCSALKDDGLYAASESMQIPFAPLQVCGFP